MRLNPLTITLALWLTSVCTVWSQPDSSSIMEILRSVSKSFGLSEQDISEVRIRDQYVSSKSGINNIYLQQKYQDIAIYNGILSIHLKDGALIKTNSRFVPNLARQAKSRLARVQASDAVGIAAQHLGKRLTAFKESSRHANRFGQEIKFTFTGGGISKEEIKAELYWLPSGKDDLYLVWQITIDELSASNYWHIFVDAMEGIVRKQDNLVKHCHFHPTSYSPSGSGHLGSKSLECPASGTPNSYRVFPPPIESPNHGNRQLMISPWNLAGPGNPATTLGWHDDGSSQYTITRGNNVYAYEDRDANNIPGFSPSDTDLCFDYPLDLNLDPSTYEEASITNLFYWNNLIHDVMYQYGFDEAAGNFQESNLGRGGKGNDFVQAEAQDGADLNNANFFTPADGQLPRMQMFLWSPVADTSPLTINSPLALSEMEILAIESAFSTNNKLSDVGAITADVVLVEDQMEGTHQACLDNPLSNGDSLVNKIALIDRGDCNFTEKVKNVQDAGAVAALITNHVSGDPFAMGGSDNSITIPAFMISMGDGDSIKTALLSDKVNASLTPVATTTPDGDFDNGIITHEYGHGISNRLTGGPSSAVCLNNEEQMGEGWSDYFALMLTTDWSTAAPETPRGIGTYVTGFPTDATGIRTYPYSTSLASNPFTYADVPSAPVIDGQVSPHYVGSIWATMLWEMTWQIIMDEGTVLDLYHGEAGNNIALQLVMEGLKLQPCNPGFVDGRDAILLADEILYDGRHKCQIWHAFAKRGLGLDAQQNDPDDFMDGIAAFNVPAGVRLEATNIPPIVPEGGEVTVELAAICACEPLQNLSIRELIPSGLQDVQMNQGNLLGDSAYLEISNLGHGDTALLSYSAVVEPCQVGFSNIVNMENVEGIVQYHSEKLGGVGNKAWNTSTDESKSPSTSWYAQNYNQTADIALVLNSPVNTSGVVKISFWHRFQTEENYDGGVVEFSIDGGLTWQDAQEYFIKNGYTRQLTTLFNDSPIAGQHAFTGFSDEVFSSTDFIESCITLCLPDTISFLLRFRFVCDGAVGSAGLNGWHIDDISIEQLPAIGSQVFLQSGMLVLDTLQHCLEIEPFVGSGIYVDQQIPVTGHGKSWSTALREVAPALVLAGCRDVDTVFIAEGKYLPTTQGDPSISFTLPDSTVLIGGFPFGGSSLNQRDPEMFISELSGDIGIPNEASDNSYIVVEILPNRHDITLDGITIGDPNPNSDQPGIPGASLSADGEITLLRTVIEKSQ